MRIGNLESAGTMPPEGSSDWVGGGGYKQLKSISNNFENNSSYNVIKSLRHQMLIQNFLHIFLLGAKITGMQSGVE